MYIPQPGDLVKVKDMCYVIDQIEHLRNTEFIYEVEGTTTKGNYALKGKAHSLYFATLENLIPIFET